ncbi:MAG TPA: SusC/RagA family TonB-linked outer membrane protein [Gemmatimonadaceae bacterium]|jgi:TonB-linked SusC/RagA family outer membrane protein|nr:SusC/RagA family TonB-linked outer membrane protein [Gemmatimonadaceae bacterium]
MIVARKTLLLLAIASVALAAPQFVAAQEGSVAGTTVTEGTQRALSGVQISVDGAPGKGAVTDASGRFRITGLTGSSVVLDVRSIGYRPMKDTVRVGANDVRISLSVRAIELNQVIVTGTAGGAEKRELGTSVSTINAADVVASTAVPSVEGLLNGRAPGVVVIPTSGQIGAGAQIRVRGVGTFSLSSTPLVYIDGIRSDNGQTGIIGRFNDIDPEQIESIEVLKGPAAATLYGTEAARGVINIITKKGAAGSTQYSFTASDGANWFQDAAGRFPTNYWNDPANNTLYTINYVTEEQQHGTPLFRDGPDRSYDGSVSGGSGLYRYYAAGQWMDDEGIVSQNSRNQKSARTNLSVVPNDKFDLETSVGYITSRTFTTPEGSGGGLLFTGEYAEPQREMFACATPYVRGCGWSRGGMSSPPEVYLASQNWQDLRRFTGSVSAKYDPFPWMSHRLLIGTDYALEDIQAYTPYQTDSTIVYFLGSSFDGSRSETTQQTTLMTYDYAGNVHFNLRPGLQSKTTFGSQYYTNTVTGLSASGTHFPTPGLSTISATGTKGTPSSSLSGNNTLGFYGQQEFSWSDRLFLTGAFRVDNNSAFGSNASWTTYPKGSLSWVASEQPAVRSKLPGFIDNLRLRLAYGGSGQQPAVNSALQTLTPIAGPNGQTVLTNGTIGNPNLKPERVLGTEAGFESGLFNDRVGVDFTYYSDVSHDAILSKNVAPSVGFGATSQFFNAGQIDKSGIELGLHGQLINRKQWGWDMQLNVATNHAKIIKLSGAPGDTNIVLGTAPPEAHRVGYSPFDFFTYDVVSATYDPTTKKATNPMCADAHGNVAPCFAPGTTNVVAPLVYFGHSLPTTEGSLSSTWRYGRFRLYSLLDFETGFNKLDNNLRINCQLDGDCIQAQFPQNYSPAIVAQVQNSGTLRNFFIKPASYAKWRELSLAYDAPDRIAGKIGAHALSLVVAMRNLSTITRYTGLDPENSLDPSGGTSGAIGLDQAEYPQLTTFLATVRLSY